MVKVFTFIVLVSTSANLVTYLCCSIAAISLSLKGQMGGRREKGFMTLLVVADVAALYAIWTLWGAGAEAFWWSIALFVAGIPVYIAMKWQRRRDAATAALAAAEPHG
jgi:APA family basic amino acid/polyamine antiporter